MKALVCTRPGVLEYEERDAPMAEPGQAIIRIKRIGICGTDLHAFEGTQPYFQYPRVLGHELSGDLIEADQAPDFVPGEAVTCIPYFQCGHCVACRHGKPNCCENLRVCGVHVDGGMVDYLSVPSSSLVHGQGLSYEELALVEPLAIGAHAVRRAGFLKDAFVLVVGAGPIGLGVMESARIAGAEVIVMDINPVRLAFCREQMQILHTLPVSPGQEGQEAAREALREITRGEMPTVVFDATGSRTAIQHAFHYPSHGGTFVLVGIQKGDLSFSHPEFHKRELTLMSSRNATREDFDAVMEALQKGMIKPTPYITHRTLFQAVKDRFPTWLDPAAGVIKAMVEMK